MTKTHDINGIPNDFGSGGGNIATPSPHRIGTGAQFDGAANGGITHTHTAQFQAHPAHVWDNEAPPTCARCGLGYTNLPCVTKSVSPGIVETLGPPDTVPDYAPIPPDALMVAHAQLRALERYGVALRLSDLRAIEDICRTGGGCLYTDPQTGAEHHAVVYADTVFFAVYRRYRSGGGRCRHVPAETARRPGGVAG